MYSFHSRLFKKILTTIPNRFAACLLLYETALAGVSLRDLTQRMLINDAGSRADKACSDFTVSGGRDYTRKTYKNDALAQYRLSAATDFYCQQQEG
ncbi:hypothetical protein [Pantoea stewartii]|uniref:hypothetical protein n=1 Tax=Pantoea stewartii TaxID=66269 RepID=UPI0006D02A97|nr:hypothetical protein [Pantoea stewartii]